MGAMQVFMQRKMHSTILVAAFFMIGSVLSACSGSGGGGSSEVESRGFGEIESLGSIVVNGVRFDVSGAQLLLDDNPSPTEDNLKVGMIVEVEGVADDSNGTANQVIYKDNVTGPILSIDETSPGLVKKLNVLGQTVVVTKDLTLFDNVTPISFETLAVDNVIEVSGQVKDDGSIFATFIQMKAATSAAFVGEFEVKGRVATVTATTFTVNTLTVDFSGVVPRNGTLAVGTPVEAKGSSFDGTTLIATDVEVKTAGLGDDIAKARVEGFITSLGGSTLTVNGQDVDFLNAAFRGGVEADLDLGVRIQAEGQLVNGLLIASRVTFKESARFESNAVNVNAAAGTLELQGLPGISVLADPNIAEFRSSSTLADVVTGNGVRIRARQGAAGMLIATRFEADVAPTDRVLIQGPAQNIDAAARSLSILGVQIDASSALCRDNDQSFMDCAAFFAALTENRMVKARFRPLVGGTWDELEFEDDN